MKTKVIKLMAIMVLAMTACQPKKTEEKSNPAISVRTSKIEYRDFAAPVSSSGIVSSSREARLSFKTGGIISRMYAGEGQVVQKGQLLATLNMTEINAQVGQLQTSYSKAKRDYERAGNLLKDSATTREYWENAGTALHVAKESLKIASFNKQFSSIYATETGIVISKLTNEGEMAAPGAPVYVINSTNDADWVIRLGVSDKDWARLRLKDKAEIAMDAYPGQTFSASVSRIDQAADLNSGTFAIELRVNPGNQKFANGLIAKAQIFPSLSQKVCLIPIEALLEADGQSANVFTLSPNKKTAIIHRVRIAYILKDRVAISSGLQNVNEVITQGVSYLTDKFPVEIQH